MSAVKKNGQIIKKTKAPFPTKEAFVFLSFLVFSTLLWFLYKTSHIQELKVEVPVSYVGVPHDVELVGKLPQSVTVKFKDKGSVLFTYILNKKLPPFMVDLTGLFYAESGWITLPTSKYEGQIFSKLKSTATATFIHIAPDTLMIAYCRLYKKMVPVRFYGYIQPAQQFMLTRGISLYPAQLEVYGNRHYLDTLKAIYTKPVVLKDIKNTIDAYFPLKVPRGIHLSREKVKVHAIVEAFTEKNLEIPITAVNVPDKYYLRTFPATVKIACIVGLSHFKSLQPEQIQVVVDYNKLTSNNAGKARVEVYSQSPDLLKYHLLPETVDYLLEVKK
jgi:hypothetical protein